MTVLQPSAAKTLIGRMREGLYFYEVILGEELSPKQKEIALAIKDDPLKRIAVSSCHASGKTYLLGDVVCAELVPYSNTIIITTAPTFKQVEEILWRQIKRAYNRAERAGKSLGGTILKTQWQFDEMKFALGLSTNQPENFAGYHAKKIIIIVDEASGVDEAIFEAIEGVLAGGEATLVLIGNPTRVSGEFARAFKSNLYRKIFITCFDTPNFVNNGILTIEDLTLDKCKNAKIFVQGMITPMWAYTLKEKYGSDSDVFRVRALGKFPKAESDTFISIDMVADAIARTQQQHGVVKIGVDVARFGSDKTVVTVRQGMKVIEKFVYQKQELMATVGCIINDTAKYKQKQFCVDVIGVGAGVADRLREQGFDVLDVNVANRPEHEAEDGMPDFLNLRAELYFRLKAALADMDLPEDDDWYEVCNIKYKFNSSGKLQIESKDEMKKRGLHSPDTADSLMLTFAEGEEGMSLDDFFIG